MLKENIGVAYVVDDLAITRIAENALQTIEQGILAEDDICSRSNYLLVLERCEELLAKKEIVLKRRPPEQEEKRCHD